MNKFTSMLASDPTQTLGARAENLAKSAVLEVNSFISNLEKEKLQLENKLNDLTDLAPENTYSLRPGTKDFNAAGWVKELHATRMEIAIKNEELIEAQAIYNEWFAPTAKPAEKAN